MFGVFTFPCTWKHWRTAQHPVVHRCSTQNRVVVVSDGNITLGQQNVSRINASMLFDFDRVELQRLEARVGSDGTLSGAGSIGLLQEKVVESPLTFALTTAKIRQEIARYQVDGTLIVKGALARPIGTP